jgi:hypothetical protein
VRAHAEAAFRELLAQHWPTLHELGFVTSEPSVIYRQLDAPPTFVEIFTWAEGGYEQARDHPAVLDIWVPMDPLLEERDGLPKWDFPHFERIALSAPDS